MEPKKHDFIGEPPAYSEQSHSAPCGNETSYTYSLVTSQAFAGHQATELNGQPTHTTVIMTQPGNFVPVLHGNVLPSNFMSLSLFTCLCCFWPLGIFAILKSREVDDAIRRGDLDAAKEASHTARRLSYYGIGVGIVLMITYTIIHVIFISGHKN